MQRNRSNGRSRSEKEVRDLQWHGKRQRKSLSRMQRNWLQAIDPFPLSAGQSASCEAGCGESENVKEDIR